MSLRKRSERYIWAQAFLGATGEIPWEGMACPMQCNLKNPPSWKVIQTALSVCQHAIWNTWKGAFVGPAGKNWFHHTTFLASGSYGWTELITGIYWMVHEWLLLFTLIIIICYSLFIYEFLINWAFKPLSVVTIANGVSHTHKFTLKEQLKGKKKENLLLTSMSFCTCMTFRVYTQ